MITARDLGLAFRLALRELRSGQRRLAVFLGCMFLGVFAIAAVGSVSEAVRAGLARDARALLGGDASVEFATQQPSDDELAWLSARGTVSRVISLRGMARSAAPTGEDTAMVALKGVDGAYPLYGAVTLDPPLPLATALGDGPAGDGVLLPGVVVDPLLLERFGVRVGDVITVGTQRFRIAAALLGEPDRVVQGITYGPRVLMSLQGLDRTGLLVPGTLLTSGARVRLPGPAATPGASPSSAPLRSADEATVTAFVEAARMAFPDAGWRVESYSRAVPRIASRMASIATLKCVGGGVATVLWTYLFQILLIGGAGIAAGCALGAAVPPLAAGLTGQLIPVQLDASVHAAPLLRAALLGLAILLAFSLRPLLLAGAVRPATLFRGYVAGGGNGLTPAGRALVGLGFAVLAGLVWLFTPDARLAWGFMAGCAGCFAVFRVVAWGLRAGARRAPHAGNPSVRLGLASIHRPGAPTVNMVFALGLGLTALVGIAQVERNLSASLARDLSRDAPAFFFINVLPGQVAEFEELGHAPGVTRMERGPMVRGRIVRIKGVPVQEVAVAPDAQWAVRGDRGLSHAATPPPDTELTAGAWWPPDYSGPPILSLSDDLARGFGVTQRAQGGLDDLPVAVRRAVRARPAGPRPGHLGGDGLRHRRGHGRPVPHGDGGASQRHGHQHARDIGRGARAHGAHGGDVPGHGRGDADHGPDGGGRGHPGRPAEAHLRRGDLQGVRGHPARHPAGPGHGIPDHRPGHRAVQRGHGHAGRMGRRARPAEAALCRVSRRGGGHGGRLRGLCAGVRPGGHGPRPEGEARAVFEE